MIGKRWWVAEGDGVGFARGDGLLGVFLRELLVGDEHTAERFLQLGAEARDVRMFAGAEERDLPVAEFAGDVVEGRGGI